MEIYDNVAIEYVMQVEELERVQSQLDFFEEKIILEEPNILETRLQKLLNQDIGSAKELEQWLGTQSKLFEEIQEVLSGVSIAFNRYNNNPEIKKRHEYHQEVIIPLLKKYSDLLNKKLVQSPYLKQLDQDIYAPLIRSKKNAIQLFRAENIALEVKESKIVNEYFDITGRLTVIWEGEEKTLPQMSKYMQDSDRGVREKAWRLVSEQLLKQDERLNQIMSELITLRQQKAQNAGFSNYRDYMFRKLERDDYTPEDCFVFYESVKKHVVPVVDDIKRNHQKELGVDSYKMWDAQAVPKGKKPLKPFETVEQLVDGTIEIFRKIDSTFAEMLVAMREHKLLDLESRKAKSPGGFCSELPVTGLSFIFMNAVGRQSDLSTMVHEGGHSVHNYLTKDLPIAAYKSVPMESAELASMTMELLTMDKWGHFYDQQEDLKRAQKEHIEDIVSFFPWAMVIDQFQHWMYTHPEHTVEERKTKFSQLAKELSHHYIDTEGLEKELEARWLMQLHLFEVPFYYIEYAIAQLGALQMWKAYHENPEQTVENYKKALSLGSSKSLKEVYETAGIQFDFSEKTIQEYIQFAQEQIERLEK